MGFLEWLQGTWVATTVAETLWGYPTFETMHTMGMALLIGSLGLINLRVLGFAPRLQLKSMIGLLPFVWVGFLINVTTGSLLFIYGAVGFGTNKAFWVKMACMVIAGLNALAFDLSVKRYSYDWVASERPPPLVKTFATLSFALWLCVVTAGRWMAYV